MKTKIIIFFISILLFACKKEKNIQPNNIQLNVFKNTSNQNGSLQLLAEAKTNEMSYYYVGKYNSNNKIESIDAIVSISSITDSANVFMLDASGTFGLSYFVDMKTLNKNSTLLTLDAISKNELMVEIIEYDWQRGEGRLKLKTQLDYIPSTNKIESHPIFYSAKVSNELISLRNSKRIQQLISSIKQWNTTKSNLRITDDYDAIEDFRSALSDFTGREIPALMNTFSSIGSITTTIGVIALLTGAIISAPALSSVGTVVTIGGMAITFVPRVISTCYQLANSWINEHHDMIQTYEEPNDVGINEDNIIATMTPTANLDEISQPVLCSQIAYSGGYGVTTKEIDLGTQSGIVNVHYEMYSVPDKMEIFWNGSLVATTGGAVSGQGVLQFNFNWKPGLPTGITIVMTGTDVSTIWDFVSDCPI